MNLLKDIQQERKDLMSKIIKVTNAEYDWPSHVKAALVQILPPIPSTDFENKLYKLSGGIKDPENLLIFLPGETPFILYSEVIAPDHMVFSGFKALFIQIDQILDLLTSSLREDMQKLKFFYTTFITSLCEADASKKTILLSPKASLIGESPFGFYRISQETARQLISKDSFGFTHKKNDAGVRPVQSLGGVHFKFLDPSLEPSRPSLEYITYAFARSLTSQTLISPSVILKLDRVSLLIPKENFPPQLIQAIREGKSLVEDLVELHLSEGGWQSYVQHYDHSFFIQASQTVGKKNLQEVLWENPQFQGNPVTMGWQFLFVLLTAPGDGKPDNYSVYEGGHPGKNQGVVVGIDNDNFFCPPLYQCEKSSHLYSGINCFFYLLDSLMDHVLPNEVIRSFLTLNPSLVVLNWLGLLRYQNFRYQQLIGQKILTQEDLRALGLPIQLSLGLAEQVMTHITHLQTKLRDNQMSTPHYLLQSLYPTVADYYQKLRQCYKYNPSVGMWYVYKAYDQRHAGSSDLKTVDKVLNLSSEDEVWKHAQKSRTNFLNDDLVSCVNKFLSHIPEDHFEANLSEILFLILYHFKGMENDFFKNFSEDIQIKAILLSKTRDYQVL